MAASETDKLIMLHLQKLEETVDRLVHSIEGNGQPGIKIRIDRLEQNAETRRWFTRTALGAAIGSIVVSIFTWLKN